MAQRPDAGELIKSITEDVKAIVRGEIELAKAELVPEAKKAGLGAGLLGAAGYLAITASGLIFTAISLCVGALFVANGMPVLLALGWSFTIVAVVLLVVAAIFGLVGAKNMKVRSPEQTIASAESAVAAVQAAVDEGLANVRDKTTRQSAHSL